MVGADSDLGNGGLQLLPRIPLAASKGLVLNQRHSRAWSSWAIVTCMAWPTEAYSEDEEGEVTVHAGRWADVLLVSFGFCDFRFLIFDFRFSNVVDSDVD